MKISFLYSLAVLALFFASCSNSGGLYPVSGKVNYKGEPAVGAFVFLVQKHTNPVDEQSMMGVVQSDGTFSIVCDAKGKGAPPGEYDLLIKWPQSSSRGNSLIHKVPDRLKGRYANPQKPPLHVVVEARTNVLPNIELTD